MEQGNLPPQSPREASNPAAAAPAAHALTATPQLMGHNHRHSKPSNTGGSAQGPLERAQYSHIINSNIMQDFILRNRRAFVMFYGSNSENMHNNYVAIQHFDQASMQNPNYAFGHFDCDVDRTMCKYFNITRYPTYKLFIDGLETNDVITDPYNLPY